MIVKRTALVLGLTVTALAAWMVVRHTVVPEVKFVAVRRGTAVLSATGNVSVMPALDARIVAPAQGILQKFTLKEGDVVKKGDIIAEIDPGQWPFMLEENRLELNRLMQRREQGSTTAIELDKLRKSYEKNLELARTGNFPQDVLERDRRDIDKLEISLRQEKGDYDYACTKLKNKIDEIQQEISKRTIRATYDGVIMAPAVLQGDLVFHGGAICNITSRNKVVKVEINQDDLEAVRGSKRAQVRFFTLGDRIFEGTRSEILPIGNQATQRFTVYVNLPDLPDSVLSAQTGEATFIADEHPDALLIPRKALLGGECFVLNGDRIDKRRIRTGYATLTDIEVLDGLKEGERVVAADVDLRRDGERVKPAAEPGTIAK